MATDATSDADRDVFDSGKSEVGARMVALGVDTGLKIRCEKNDLGSQLATSSRNCSN
jgi:hypothetical protein